jgi:metal-sulfur cluster biosynthetic enzyme
MTADAADRRARAEGGGTRVTRDQVYAALTAVKDPELPMSVVDLGLIYDVRVDGTEVEVDMTLTSTGCPVHELIVDEVHDTVAALEGVSFARVNVVWDPPWSRELITPTGRTRLASWGIGS